MKSAHSIIKKIGSAITLPKSCASILITDNGLNCHNELFCVQNGVINLQTGELYPLAPNKYLITQQSPAIYRPGYRNPIVDNFLTSILPDEETRAALVRFIGYSATGEVIEERASFLYGGNDKGTLTKTLMYLFGNYATPLKTDAVLLTVRTQDAGAATTELNPLEFCRIAIVEELPQGGLTLPNSKTSRVPRDPGLLRRLLNIDFTQSFIGIARDPYLKKKLAEPDAQSGFLSLFVDAAVFWYRDELLESSAIKQATYAFLNENNFIGEFITEHCERGQNFSFHARLLGTTEKGF